MQEITIKRPLAMHLLSLAQLRPEQEICGLIGCIDSQLTTCYPIANIAKTPEDVFLMCPDEEAIALKSMQKKGETVFAVYHSHPTSFTAPSQAGMEQLGYSDAMHLVISLSVKGVLEMAAYRLQNGSVESIELRI